MKDNKDSPEVPKVIATPVITPEQKPENNKTEETVTSPEKQEKKQTKSHKYFSDILVKNQGWKSKIGLFLLLNKKICNIRHFLITLGIKLHFLKMEDYGNERDIMDWDAFERHNKSKTNMIFKQRLQDRWYWLLEKIFAPGCYFVKAGSDVLNLNPDYICNSSIDILTEKGSHTFGKDVEINFVFGKIFYQNLVCKRVLGISLYFSRPFSIGDIKIALGTRSFFENDTLVLACPPDIQERTYSLNLPSHAVSFLKAFKFICKKGEKEFVYLYDDIKFSCYSYKGYITCSRTDYPESGKSDLNISVQYGIDLCYPIVEEGKEDEKYKNLYVYAKRFAAGFYFVRADKTGFVDEKQALFGLRVGDDDGPAVDKVTLETELAKRLEKALKALDDSLAAIVAGGSVIPFDEIFTGNNALFEYWHRGHTI